MLEPTWEREGQQPSGLCCQGLKVPAHSVALQDPGLGQELLPPPGAAAGGLGVGTCQAERAPAVTQGTLSGLLMCAPPGGTACALECHGQCHGRGRLASKGLSPIPATSVEGTLSSSGRLASLCGRVTSVHLEDGVCHGHKPCLPSRMEASHSFRVSKKGIWGQQVWEGQPELGPLCLWSR